MIALVYYKASQHDSNDGALHIIFSDDYADTWSDEDKYLDGSSVTGFPMNPPDASAGEDANEPLILMTPSGEPVVIMWRINWGVSQNGMYQSRGSAGGRSWSTPSQIDFQGIDNDNLIMSTDDYFVLDDMIYLGSRQTNPANSSESRSLVFTSPDGETWTLLSAVTTFASKSGEIALEYVGNDKIISIMREGSITPWQAQSADLGETWTGLRKASIPPSIRHRMATLSHLMGESTWWDDPRILMWGCHTINEDNLQRRLCVWFSPDRGTTWSSPLYLDDVTEDSGYATVFYDPTTETFVLVSYWGTRSEAVLKQYRFALELN